MSKVLFTTVLMIAGVLPSFLLAQQVLPTVNVESKLYLGKGKKQPLIVGLGGSEGGNAWASEHWKNTRDQFLAKGYAFLALGYFGAKGTPEQLNKIAIDEVYAAIKLATATKGVNPKKIAIVGGSRGGDLALLLAAHYPNIKCVVALVPSHVAFPGNTNHFSTSAWTYQGKELPFVPVNEAAFPHLMKRDLRATFMAMLQDSLAEEKALIKVEKINGPIFLLSATLDEIAPTTPMCEKMMTRLKEKGFKHYYEHLAVEGGHAEPLKYFEQVFAFLDKNLLGKK